MTFKKAFNDIFSEPLNEHGFQYNKKYGMYFRFVNDELLQYITYTSFHPMDRGLKSYRIFLGIYSIYANSFSKEELLQYGTDLYSLGRQYFDEEKVKDIYCYSYNEATMMEVIEQSLKNTIELAIPVFEKVNELNLYIEYRKKAGINALWEPAEFETEKNDALVLIKTDNHDDFQDFFQEKLNNRNGASYEEYYELLYDSIIKRIPQSRDKIYESPELYVKVMDEIEKRKEANLKILGEIGVIGQHKKEIVQYEELEEEIKQDEEMRIVCTVFYRGKLKKKHTVNELFNVIIDSVKDNGWLCNNQGNRLEINLNDGESELLIFEFDNHKMNGFCKIYAVNDEVYKNLFDMFYTIEPMFYIFDIDDDYGMWADYIAKKSPCKIKLRELTEDEFKRINRYDENAKSSGILLGIIGKDIRKNENDEITYQYLVDSINPNVPTYFEDRNFFSIASILETWVYETMKYKNYGKVCDIDKNTRGLNSSIVAFSFGIAETLFGEYGGSTGPKQAQIRKLYELEIYNKKKDIDKEHMLMYRFVLSVLDYLGFKR